MPSVPRAGTVRDISALHEQPLRRAVRFAYAAAVVKMIFELALTMKNASDIVKALYEKQTPTPGEYRKSKGKSHYDISRSRGIWDRSSVLRILGDERYTGTYIMGKRAVTEIGGTHMRLKPEDEWFKIPDHHPAIVSRELYDEVQAGLRHFKCPKTPREYTLKAKVMCGCCRHALQLAPRKIPAFVCRYTKVDENAECYGLEIGEQELESLLFDIINKQAQVILNIDSLDDTTDFSFQLEQQAEYEKHMEKCRNEKQNLYERFVLGEIDTGSYKSEKAVIDGELDRLCRVYDTLKTEVAAAADKKNSDDELRGLAETTLKADTLTRTLVNLLIDKVYVYPGNHVEIIWKVAGFHSNETEARYNVEKQAG